MKKRWNAKNKEAEKDSIKSVEGRTDVAPADQPLDTVLERLPTQFREEILKQYDMPKIKVSILDIFRYATPLEYAMQVLGIFMAILAGILDL
jgi:hypothetical protein